METDEKQIDALLQRPTEGLHVELKTWLDPRPSRNIAKLVKAIFALRNRNGGFLIIGFNDTNKAPDRYTLGEDVERLYRMDTIQGLISRYASIPFEIGVKFGKRDGLLHPVVVVPNGVNVPVVVSRDLIDNDNGGKKLLQVGEVYFRTLHSNGTPSSARLLPADYPELLDICFENREADIGRFLRRHLPALREHLKPVQKLEDQAFTLIENGINTFKAAVNKRGVTSEFERVSAFLSMHVGLVLDPPNPDELSTGEFMNKISASNPSYTGWPMWCDSRRFRNEEDQAIVLDGVWQALIVERNHNWLRYFEFLRFDPKGEFYLRRVMQDDLSDRVTPCTAMDVVLMIYQVAEALAVGVNMAKGLGWSPSTSTAGFAFRWTGLEGRELDAWAKPLYLVNGTGRKSHSHGVKTFVQVPVETPHSALAPFVAAAIGPLFASFEGHIPSLDLVETCVKKMIQRKRNC